MKNIIAGMVLIMILLTTAFQTVQAQENNKKPAFDFDPPTLPPSLVRLTNEGITIVGKEGKYGFKVVDGKLIIPYEYDNARVFSNGLAAVQLNDKWGYIDKNNKVIIPFKYDDAGIFSEGLAAVAIQGKYGFINSQGELVIPLKYEDTYSPFMEGLAAVKQNDKCGYIDYNAKVVIPFRYDEAYRFKDGKALVIYKEKYFSIDRLGNEIEE